MHEWRNIRKSPGEAAKDEQFPVNLSRRSARGKDPIVQKNGRGLLWHQDRKFIKSYWLMIMC